MSNELFEAKKEIDTKEFLIALITGKIEKPEHKSKVNRIQELMRDNISQPSCTKVSN